MTDINIPPEVVEAANEAFTNAMLSVPQPDPMEAALIAGLKAWPGMQTDCERRVSEKWIGVREFPVIILPLHHEAGDEG